MWLPAPLLAQEQACRETPPECDLQPTSPCTCQRLRHAAAAASDSNQIRRPHLVAMQIDDDIVFIQEGAIQALLNEKLTNDRWGQAAGLTAG